MFNASVPSLVMAHLLRHTGSTPYQFNGPVYDRDGGRKNARRFNRVHTVTKNEWVLLEQDAEIESLRSPGPVSLTGTANQTSLIKGHWQAGVHQPVSPGGPGG